MWGDVGEMILQRDNPSGLFFPVPIASNTLLIITKVKWRRSSLA